MEHKFAKVIIDNRASKLDKLFTYILKDKILEVAKVGMRVLVPFGRNNKIIKGLIIQISDESDEVYKFKDIIDVLDDKSIIDKKLIDLAIWLKEQYICTYVDAFQPILPPGDYKNINYFIELIDTNYKPKNLEEREIISYLETDKLALLENLKKELKVLNINKYIKELELLGVIEIIIDIKTSIMRKKQKWARLNNNLSSNEISDIIGDRALKQLSIVTLLQKNAELSLEDIMSGINVSLSTIKTLEQKNVLHIFEKSVNREAVKKTISKYQKHKLNYEQNLIFEKIMGEIKSDSNKKEFLIHGITGSGKTEVYLQIVEQMLKEDKDIIILVPEISLTPQTIDRFMGRFGNKVAVLHSRLSQGERFDEWHKIKTGKVKIVVGARSAIFAPFKNLGLIIIDEEHESTYKSSQNPKYQTVEVARKRVKMEESAFLILGTATPSLETYNRALNGDIELLELNKRANKISLPEVILVDMKDELKSGNTSMFSQILYKEMVDTLNSNKQIILFLNKRGFSSFISCRNCGYVAKCNSCEISMTYYKHIHKLRCHYCGITEEVPYICPKCNSKYIKYFGIGTEQIEEMVNEYFPAARVKRMDSDSVVKKGSYEKILDDMKIGKIDILIGTQMISKGLDFENVSLVGIVSADTSLNLPDYKAAEKTFQLITQVAGRSGRGEKRGKVVLQTYNPEHYSIVYAKNQDYISFFNSEIVLRKEFLYPPFLNLINILVYGKNKFNVGKLIKEIYNIIGREIHSIYKNHYRDYIIGPSLAPIEKIKNNYRYQILLKIPDEKMDDFKTLVQKVCIYNEYKLDIKNVKISIDINPVNIL